PAHPLPTAAPPATPLPPRTATLLRVREPDQPERTVPVGESPSIIGRTPECDVVVQHEKLSGRHCDFALVPGGVRVRDLKSTNGLRFRGEPFDEKILRDAEEFTAGPVTFVVVDPRTEAVHDLPPAARKALPFVAVAVAVLALLGAAAAFAPALLKALRGGDVAPPQDPRNLIRTNADFEDPTRAGWKVTAEEGKAEVAADPAIRHDGSASLRIRGVDTRDRSLVTASSERVAIEPGTRLRLEGWLKASGLEGNAGYRIEWLRGEERVGATPTEFPSGTFDWRLLAVTGTPPPDADGARAACVVAGLAGLAWFDTVRLMRTDAAPGGSAWQTLGGTLTVDEACSVRLDTGAGPAFWNGELHFVRSSEPDFPTPHWVGTRDGDPSSVGLGLRAVRRVARLGSVTLVALHAEDQDALTWSVDVATEGEIRFACRIAPGPLTTRIGTQSETRTGDFEAHQVGELILGEGPSLALSDPATVTLGGNLLWITWRKIPAVSIFLRGVPSWIEKEIRALTAQATAAEKAGEYGKALLLWADLAGRNPNRPEGRTASRRASELRRTADDLVAAAKAEVASARKFPSKAGTRIALEKIDALDAGYAGTEYAETARALRAELLPPETPPDPPPDVVPPDNPATPEQIENARKLLVWAEEAVAREEWLKAEIYAKNVMDRWPGSPEEMKAGEILGRARSGAKAAAERDAWIRDTLSRARNLVRNSQADKAKPLFEEVLQKHPDHPLVKGVREELEKLGR
ncbi:MAG: FHA domain-containing protein, partial [Candidatus Brocadiae bacterium]|nr:FHA domain-containing protein [Candidatus Brocadiia bacterium]